MKRCPAGASCYALDEEEPEPEPDVEGVVRRLNGEDVRLRPGALEPRLGCMIVSHQILGWCSGCPGIDGRAELLGWRYHALSPERVPGPEWAREVSR